MTSATGHYDQNLLASAPEVTGERRREGYTTEILNPSPGKATPPPTAQSDVETGLVIKEYNQLPARPLPFWRTRKGMITIAIVGIVILGAVIGGAVGGTAGKKDPKGAIPNPSAPDGSDGNGVGFPGVKGSSTSTESVATPSGSTTAPPGAATTDVGGGVGSGPIPTSSVPTGPNAAPAGGDNGKDGGQNGNGQTDGGTLLGGLISNAQLAGIVEHA